MDPIKEAFLKIKEDIFALQEQILELKQEINHLQNQQKPSYNPTINTPSTDNPTHIPTLPQEIRGFQNQKIELSTGNKGVPTDNPTNQQTTQQTNNTPERFAQSTRNNSLNEFQQARDILDSLDNLKKGIRLKFKRLTPQEMLVFSTLYMLEEQKIEQITYKLISNYLKLSESSIRDYTNKLIQKGIPLVKIRQNNKKITLSISPELKNVVTLATITQLREL